jgi:hypothetical protein
VCRWEPGTMRLIDVGFPHTPYVARLKPMPPAAGSQITTIVDSVLLLARFSCIHQLRGIELHATRLKTGRHEEII